jgi:endoglucanase
MTRPTMRRLGAALALLPLLLLSLPASGAPAPEAGASRTEDNPLAGRAWGVYQGPADQAWAPWVRATGEEKELLARIALAPKAKWFGDWIPNAEIARKAADYIANSQAGDPEALVQMTVFRMVPWEGDACRRLPTKAERASYKDWTDRLASAIGSAHVAIVLQPDGPFALCAPKGSLAPSRLIAYSTRVLSALPNTSVYIEVGAADWPHPSQGGVDAVLRFLVPSGIQYARGIALNGTHYSSTPAEVARGAAVVQALEARGIVGKKVVVNTSSNGKPFEFGRYDGPDAENARVCRSATDPQLCVTLGIPPTADVANPLWGLPVETNALASQYVDAYLWFGRPWLYKQADPFVKQRALALVRSTPY